MTWLSCQACICEGDCDAEEEHPRVAVKATVRHSSRQSSSPAPGLQAAQQAASAFVANQVADVVLSLGQVPVCQTGELENDSQIVRLLDGRSHRQLATLSAADPDA